MERERYTLVNIFENDYWSPKSPVEVLRGAIIQDNLIGQRCVQLSLVSAVDKRISSVSVEVTCFGEDGERVFDEPVGLIFREINAGRGVSFGEDETHYLRSDKPASLICAVTRVVFSDGRVWRIEDEPIKISAHRFDELDDRLKAIFSELLADSFYAKVDTEYKYLPRQDEEYWVCTCGRANEKGRTACLRCGMNRTWIMQNLNVVHLRRIHDERVGKAKREAEEERRKAREAAVREALAVPVEPVSTEKGDTKRSERVRAAEPAAVAIAEQAEPTAQGEAVLAVNTETQAVIDEYEQSAKPPILRYVLLGVLGVALLAIGVLIFLLSTDRIPLPPG